MSSIAREPRRGLMRSLPLALWMLCGLGCAQVTDVQPNPAPAGLDVTITGAGFGPSQGAGRVLYGTDVMGIVSWSDTKIVATLPGDKPDGEYVISVNAELRLPATSPHIIDSPNGPWSGGYAYARHSASFGGDPYYFGLVLDTENVQQPGTVYVQYSAISYMHLPDPGSILDGPQSQADCDKWVRQWGDCVGSVIGNTFTTENRGCLRIRHKFVENADPACGALTGFNCCNIDMEADLQDLSISGVMTRASDLWQHISHVHVKDYFSPELDGPPFELCLADPYGNAHPCIFDIP